MSIELERIIQSIAISVNNAQKAISSNDSFLVDIEESDVSLTFSGEIDEESFESGKGGLIFSRLNKRKLRKAEKEDDAESSTITMKFLFVKK